MTPALLINMAIQYNKMKARGGRWIPSGKLYSDRRGNLQNMFKTWSGPEAIQSWLNQFNDGDRHFIKNFIPLKG